MITPTRLDKDGWPVPPEDVQHLPTEENNTHSMYLVEIPSDFQGLKAVNPDLGLKWRTQTRIIFEDLFSQGYMVTDFIFLPGTHPRSFYIVSHKSSTLGD
jgi:predicted GNAT superfamily acetyltransferase